MLQELTERHELIVFWEEGEISRVLLGSDFHACLDGYVALQIFAGRSLPAIYVELDATLSPVAFVFFEMSFDAAGWAERSWNLPLRHMAEIAAAGPDLGRGPVRLVCRSQNSMSWLGDRLWDPLLQSDRNEFLLTARAVAEMAPRLGLRPVSPPSSPNIPVLADRVERDGEDQERRWRLEGERDALKRELEERDLRLRTVGAEHAQQMLRRQFEHEQAVAILQAQHAKLLAQQKLLKEQNDALSEQLEVLQGQLQNSEARSRRAVHEAESDLQLQLQRVRQSHEDSLHQSLEQANRRWREEVLRHEQALQGEIEAERSRRLESDLEWQRRLQERQDQIDLNLREIAALQQALEGAASQGAEAFLARLEQLGMNFLVYHAGVGHVSVPVAELASYAGDPLAYAARKSFVSPDLYRAWLRHYDDPRCLHELPQGECCAARIIRVDSPARFIVGESDRCARHHRDSNIDAVLRFRTPPAAQGDHS